MERSYPEDAVVLERVEWGNFHGFLEAVKTDGKVVASGTKAWDAYEPLQDRANKLRGQIQEIEKNDIGAINYRIEQIRLAEKRLQLDGKTRDSHPAEYARLDERRMVQDAAYEKLRLEMDAVRKDLARDALLMKTVDGKEVEIPLARVVRRRCTTCSRARGAVSSGTGRP